MRPSCPSPRRRCRSVGDRTAPPDTAARSREWRGARPVAPRMTVIGIIGAGNIGSQLARLAVQHGHQVVIANSRGPETLQDLVAELGDGARAATRDEAASAGEVVVVTTPLAAIETIPVEPLVGKVVIDTNNYYPQRDGHIAQLDDETTTTAELLQDHLRGAHVVKAFNHIGADALTGDASPAGTPDRRALVVAGDDEDAKRTVAAIIDEFGFDVVDAGPLAEGWRIQRDTPGYGPRFTADELRGKLAEAKRYRDQ
ncbi:MULTISPECIES: NAD(P)-binding domain-containing protein [unclassified Curtobacterium]|uniref:NADPH-dependent F420 reductase n=1 Tax=unclassified Curtobacterium TaxID=257496 RepID=UPI001113793F|nr:MULTISPECIES: NAD(P)-binding domain-containing protein [unclassified Curtobacterium]WIB01325.1 NAD(P)-binding domain-containing protein [Curtobacterium sp. MCBA15_012]